MSRRGIGAGTDSGSIGPGGSARAAARRNGARAAARRSGACACPGRSRTGSGGPALRDIDDDGGRFEVDEKRMERRAGEVGQGKDQVA